MEVLSVCASGLLAMYCLPLRPSQSPEIDSLEERVIEVWKNRSEMLVMRRQHDVQDLMEECSRIDGGVNIPCNQGSLLPQH